MLSHFQFCLEKIQQNVQLTSTQQINSKSRRAQKDVRFIDQVSTLGQV